MHFLIRGTGAPTVVIDPGFWDDGAGWRPLAERLADTAPVLTYSRAAYGSNNRAHDRRTSDDIAPDLAAVIDATGVCATGRARLNPSRRATPATRRHQVSDPSHRPRPGARRMLRGCSVGLPNEANPSFFGAISPLLSCGNVGTIESASTRSPVTGNL